MGLGLPLGWDGVSRGFSWGFGSPVFYHELWREGTRSPASSPSIAAQWGWGQAGASKGRREARMGAGPKQATDDSQPPDCPLVSLLSGTWRAGMGPTDLL